MPNVVKRYFATLSGQWGTRQVHYRRAGSGPTVFLLHQSPQSSREMEGLMQQWAADFTLIAPDTPGYGQSDPLGPEILHVEDFANAVIEFADAIGVRRFGIYGFHTGASIGTALAHLHPERVSALAANGFVVLTENERTDLLARYLPKVIPQWDGSHLAWAWGRVREQTVFFPWYEHARANRMDFDMPDADSLQASLLEFLRAGEHYQEAYRAAFDYRGELALPEMRVPALLTAAAWDPLASHLDRINRKSATVNIEQCENPLDTLRISREHLLRHPGTTTPAPSATRPIAGRLWQEMIATSAGQTRVMRGSGGLGPPVAVVHDAGGSADTTARLAEPLVGRRPVIVTELPGHGESSAPSRAGGPGISECAGNLRDQLAALGAEEGELVGLGVGGLIAAEVLGTQPQSGGSRHGFQLTWIDVPLLPAADRQAYRDHGLPSTNAVWHGGHLLLSWHMLRDSRMFFPWFRRTRSGSRQIEADLDERRLHLEFRELLKASGCWQSLLRELLGQPLERRLRELTDAISFGASADSAWLQASREAATIAPRGDFRLLPEAPAEWLHALLTARGTGVNKAH